MHFHLPVVANHDELSATFHQVKPALTDFSVKRVAAYLVFHIAHRPAKNAAIGHGFCTE